MTPAERTHQDESLYSLTSALRNAAYVSMGGRAYRLFSEGETDSLGDPFRLETFRVPEAGECPECPPAAESVLSSAPIESPTVVPVEPGDEKNVVEETLLFPLDESETPEDLSIRERIRRSRAVEGVCHSASRRGNIFGQKADTASPTVADSPRLFKLHLAEVLDETAENTPPEQAPRRADRILFVRPERIVLPIRDVKPLPPLDATLSNVPPEKEENGTKTVEDRVEQDAENRAVSVEFLLRTPPMPGPHFRLPKNDLPEKTSNKPAGEVESGTKTPCRPPFFRERKFFRVSKRDEPAIFRPRPWKPLERAAAPELPEPQETPTWTPVVETFDASENTVFAREDERAPTASETVSGWQLFWQPAWPRELASLEREASDEIRSLADHLESQRRRGRRIVSFNGLLPGDGCTTMSLCASRELAERGYRLLLADAHRQNPELARLLEIELDPHLYEIVTLIPEKLELLPWSETPIETAEGRTQSFEDLVASMRGEFDFLLLDGGPLIGSSLSRRIGDWRRMGVDGILLVCNARNRDSRRLQGVSQHLRKHGIELLGVTENYVPES